MNPICHPCQLFFRPKKTGFYFIEGMPQEDAVPGKAEAEKWTPYKIWAGDLFECPECKSTIIVGVPRLPVIEHYQPEFEATKRQLDVTFQVNDC